MVSQYLLSFSGTGFYDFRKWGFQETNLKLTKPSANPTLNPPSQIGCFFSSLSVILNTAFPLSFCNNKFHTKWWRCFFGKFGFQWHWPYKALTCRRIFNIIFTFSFDNHHHNHQNHECHHHQQWLEKELRRLCPIRGRLSEGQ